MTSTPFGNMSKQGALSNSLGPGTAILRGFALERETLLLDALFAVAARSHFRHMVTPGGFHMSVAMTNCGAPRSTSRRTTLCIARPISGRWCQRL